MWKKVLLVVLVLVMSATFAYAGKAQKTATGANQGTVAFRPCVGSTHCYINVSVDINGVATVQLQRKFPGRAWRKVYEWEEDAERGLQDFEGGTRYRLWVTSYTSGTIYLRLSN